MLAQTITEGFSPPQACHSRVGDGLRGIMTEYDIIAKRSHTLHTQGRPSTSLPGMHSPSDGLVENTLQNT